MFRCVALLAAVAAAASAYDFFDGDVNQDFFDEFESLNKDVTFSRQRRDAEVSAGQKRENAGDHVSEIKRDFACCSGNKYDPDYYQQMQELKKQCALQFRTNNSDVQNFDPFDCGKMSRIKQLIICENECFARAVNVIDGRGKFNRAAIVSRYAEHLVGEIKWKRDVYEEYIDMCLALVETKQPENGEKCSSITMDFHRCVWSKFILGCPAELRVDSPKCNQIRVRLSQGSAAFFNQKLLRDFLLHAHE